NGIAGMVQMSDQLTSQPGGPGGLGSQIGASFDAGATFLMIVNTTGAPQTYTLPAGITLPGQGTTITVPGGTPPTVTPASATSWNPTANQSYLLIHAHGDLHLLNVLTVTGDFNMLVTPASLQVTAGCSLDLKAGSLTVLSFHVTGQMVVGSNGLFLDVSI